MGGATTTGPNFEIVSTGARATVRVWRRPDRDADEGAEDASTVVRHLLDFAAHGGREVVLDLREAPMVTGPRTVDALGEAMSRFEKLGVFVVVLVGDSALQALQIKRLVTELAATCGAVFSSPPDAEAWLQGRQRKREP